MIKREAGGRFLRFGFAENQGKTEETVPLSETVGLSERVGIVLVYVELCNPAE